MKEKRYRIERELPYHKEKILQVNQKRKIKEKYKINLKISNLSYCIYKLQDDRKAFKDNPI